MANDKFSELMEEARELAREDGYSEGVAAVLAALEQFLSSLRKKLSSREAGKGRSSSDVAVVEEQARSASRIRRPQDKELLPRMSSGTLNQLVTDAFKSNAPKAVGPTSIQVWIHDNRGEEIAFSSLRRTIDRLTVQGVLEEIGDTKTWRYRESKKTEEPSGGTPGSSNPGGVVPLRR